jgi:hypothetical protein
MSDMIMPKFGDSGNENGQRLFTDQELEEAYLIAAWREQRWDVVVELVNAHCGLQLAWYDPLFDSVEGETP